MNQLRIKKITHFFIYCSFLAYVLFAFLVSFEVIKTSNFHETNMMIDKINNVSSFILIILLGSETIRFVSRNDEDLIKNKNIKFLTKKENIKSIFRLMGLVIPFLTIKFVRFMFINKFNNSLPVSIQIVTIIFLVMSIILIGLITYIVLSYIFKKNWLIEENGEINFSLWIEKYEPSNTENDECDINIEINFINLIKHFLAYSIHQTEIIFKILKTKIIKTDKMRNMPPLNN
ncbi:MULTISPECIES: hypothetical protein [Mesoplasma]|uniref:Uncharacterized protein n=1 Tax=Mesoplasma florum TaxID=2151 RepID=A0A2R3P7W0_MESFO|nr:MULTISPECIES: hypothetical protein [Mesoplasma]AVN64570.1 hypothetical protein CG003_02770 [Mesoplasma florum]